MTLILPGGAMRLPAFLTSKSPSMRMKTIGIFNSYTEYLTTSSLASVLVFVAIIVFLQFRPQGIVVQRTRAMA